MNDIKKKILNHVEKHHKKYLFWAWNITGLLIVKITIIILTFFGIASFIGKSEILESESQMYQAVGIFNKLHDIAHEELEESAEEWNPFTETGKVMFTALDNEFHDAKTLTEKFRTSKKIANLLIEQEKNHPNPNNVNLDPKRDAEFNSLLNSLIRMY